MKELVVACVSLMALAVAGGAGAADFSLLLPVNAPAASTVYDWTGFYAGGHLGYAWGSSDWTAGAAATPSASGALDLFQPFNAFNDTGSFFEGVQAGYNYMLPNRVLLGAETDVSFPSFPNNAGISIGGASTFTSPALGAVN